MYAQFDAKDSCLQKPSTRIIEISRGKYGYGFTLSGQAPCFVSWVVKFSPADKIGLQVGDYVISVNGHNVSRLSHEEIVKLIGVCSGTLFLGVSKSLEAVKSTDDSGTNHFFNIEGSRKVSARCSARFTRTEKVPKSSHSGIQLESMWMPPPGFFIGSKPESDDLSSSSSLAIPSLNGMSSVVMLQSVVAYLGTVEIAAMEASFIPQASMDTMKRCIQQLRIEQHIHRRVLMKITQTCVKLCNADGEVIAVYKSTNLRFSTVCPDDGRFFCLVTNQDGHSQASPHEKNFNHIFMVDPEVSPHSVHEDKAKRFGIRCSPDSDADNCIEFPQTPKNLLAVIRLLYTSSTECAMKYRGEKSQPVDESQAILSNAVHVIDPRHHSASNSTVGESKRPKSPRIAWSTVGSKKQNKDKIDTKSVADENMPMNPKKLFSTEFGGDVPSKCRQGSTYRVASPPFISKSLERPRKNSNYLTVPSRVVATSDRVKRSNISALSQQNVTYHNKQTRLARPHTDRRSPNIPNFQVPPPMHKLSMGKYRIPEMRRPQSCHDQHSMQNEGFKSKPVSSGKRTTRFKALSKFSSRGLSKSSENVATSDDDPLSASSSIESLSSNASLPSSVSSLTSGNYGRHIYHRSSLRDAAEINEVAAGRISHWAVSFERLLDDPLGVKYFKEFLCKEFSEENILFWEACEDLRRAPPDEQLKQEIELIYNRFLSPTAVMPVNIDSSGKQLAEEALTLPAHPDVFENQQHQVYTLMRLDSYSRFLKSPLYRQCMLSEMEGRPLPLDVQEGGDGDRMNKKNKGSKRGLFSFKNRSKSARRRDEKSLNPLSRKSSVESSSSESGFSGHVIPVTRTTSLPASMPKVVDPTRICHVTLWDASTTVVCAKASGGKSVAEALESLCENRGVRLPAVDVYLTEDQASTGESKPRRPLSMDMDVSALASRSIVLERRALFRLDMLPVKRSVGIKARPSKTIAEVLRPVLHKYDMQLDDLVVKISGEETALKLDEAVIALDGLRIVVEKKSNSTKKEDCTRIKKGLEQNPKKASFHSIYDDKKGTEELIGLMSALQRSNMEGQRGLLSDTDLELPEFLKIKPLNVGSNCNNNNNNKNNSKTSAHATIKTVSSCGDLPSQAMTSVTSNSLKSAISATSAHTPLRRTSGSGRNPRKCYVELNAKPITLTSFKPASRVQSFGFDHCDDLNDTTIVEDPESPSFDLDRTLQPLPTPPVVPRDRREEILKLPMAAFSPPTPLSKKLKKKERDETIMV